MKLEINIPKEFEEHFKTDKFEDSLQRIRYDIHKAFIGKKELLSGRYEIELLDMLTEAFQASECVVNNEEIKEIYDDNEFEWGGEGD